jgi:hypothetical protein
MFLNEDTQFNRNNQSVGLSVYDHNIVLSFLELHNYEYLLKII